MTVAKLKDMLKVIGLLVLLGLSGCSLFPDKEKQYLKSQEMPPLALPPDLQAGAESEAVYREKLVAPVLEASEDGGVKNTDIPLDKEPELVVDQSEPVHIRLYEVHAEAWRLVGKTLAHMGLEVLDRNEEDALYYVVYEEEQVDEDQGFWSSLSFWVDNGRHQEYDLRVKCLAGSGFTRVFVLDVNGKPIENGPGMNLIEKLHLALQQ